MKRCRLSKSIWAAALAVVVAGALSLTACGGSGTTRSSPSASGTPSPTPSEVVASPAPSFSPTMTADAVAAVKPGEKLPSFAQLEKMFAYDSSQPLVLSDEASTYESTDTVSARNIVYAGAGRKVNAALYMPVGDGPYPAVLIQTSYPYSEEPMISVGDAQTLADAGYACLMVDLPQQRDLTAYHTGRAMHDVREYVRTVIDLRRGIDLLASLPQVDGGRIGFMGEDTAGSLGAILAGVDDRIKAYALALTGGYVSTLLAWDTRPGGEHYLTSGGALPLKGAAMARYEAQMSVVDPVHYIGHNKGASFLVVDMKNEWPAVWRMKEVTDLLKAAPKPKTLRWYDNGQSHSGMTLYGTEDKMQEIVHGWLERTL